jgi:hypothetical protein
MRPRFAAPSPGVDDGQRLVLQLAPGDSHHPIATGGQNLIAPAVGLKRSPLAVELMAVDLDDDALGRPQEVDLDPSSCALV